MFNKQAGPQPKEEENGNTFPQCLVESATQRPVRIFPNDVGKSGCRPESDNSHGQGQYAVFA